MTNKFTVRVESFRVLRRGLDREVSRIFSRAFTEYQPEIIALIQQEQAEREGSQ